MFFCTIYSLVRNSKITLEALFSYRLENLLVSLSETVYQSAVMGHCCIDVGKKNNLFQSNEVGTILRAQHESGRYIAAICAAPIALKSHGIAPGILVTSHPSVKTKLVEGGRFIQ